MHYNQDMVTVRGDDFLVTSRVRITGNGSRFDGRMRYELRRVSDGAMFAWLGTRQSKTVAANAKLYPR